MYNVINDRKWIAREHGSQRRGFKIKQKGRSGSRHHRPVCNPNRNPGLCMPKHEVIIDRENEIIDLFQALFSRALNAARRCLNDDEKRELRRSCLKTAVRTISTKGRVPRKFLQMT